jgi:hypothetical protein
VGRARHRGIAEHGCEYHRSQAHVTLADFRTVGLHKSFHMEHWLRIDGGGLAAVRVARSASKAASRVGALVVRVLPYHCDIPVARCGQERELENDVRILCQG